MRVFLALSVLLLAGCTAPSTTTPGAGCVILPVTEGTQSVCVEADGWILQGQAWNLDATNGSVLLVHGLNEDRHPYDELGARLAARGLRVVAFDGRGHGQSIHRTDGSTRTLRDFDDADFLAMERDVDAYAVKWRPDVVVGASVGSSEALRYAAGAQPQPAAALLSPGLAYRGIDATNATRDHRAAILLVASHGDEYALGSARWMAQHHADPRELVELPGDAHGTNVLRDAGFLARLDAWIGARAAAKS